MCKYCNLAKLSNYSDIKQHETLHNNIFTKISLNKKDWFIIVENYEEYNDDLITKFKIKYCPFCGRNLKQENNELQFKREYQCEWVGGENENN